MATKKRRGRRHPGVVLIKPEASKRMGWRARFLDPDSGKYVKVALDRSLTSLEQREEWAIRKSRDLAKRRFELEGGAARATGKLLVDAVDGYYSGPGVRLSQRSRTDYGAATTKLLKWAARAGVRSVDDLTRGRLLKFRESIVNELKQGYVAGRGRGARLTTAELRAPETVNGELRKVRSVLGYLRSAELLPRLSNDDLRDTLKRIPVVSERVEYLRPHECQRLLDAALRHDCTTFTETREEHARAGRAHLGTTPRYAPIAPFVAHVLLTGMRFSEALALDWNAVDLVALDNDGQVVGEIHLAGANVKTKKARTIDLAVSPALRLLLSCLRLRAATGGSVFRMTEGEVQAAAKRLKQEFGAPQNFTWQMLRRTCGTFLTNAPGIFGSASAFRSAAQLGHSVQVAQRHYLGLERGISRSARTLEAAMQIEAQCVRVVEQFRVVRDGRQNGPNRAEP